MIDASLVVRVWEKSFPRRFWVDEELIRFNCAGLDESSSFVTEEGFILVKRGEGVAFISALGFLDPQYGEDLIARSRRELVGVEQWQFGGDRRHFFPGVPVECGTLSEVLSSCGFVRTGSPVFDLERDLVDYQPRCEVSTLARVCTRDDHSALTEFFDREFPGRWKDDTLEKFGEDPSRVVGLFLDGRCEGFAMTQIDGDAHRRAGAVWSHDLGTGWAALGPIGVSRALRGQGHGDGLLAWSLSHLRDLGARRTIIDWTTLTSFYGRHGFEVSRQYVSCLGRVS